MFFICKKLRKNSDCGRFGVKKRKSVLISLAQRAIVEVDGGPNQMEFESREFQEGHDHPFRVSN